MTYWEYTHINFAPGEDYFESLRTNGQLGWEAWHMEVNERGWRSVFFKRGHAEQRGNSRGNNSK